jgi:hypothetical protein
LWVRVPLYSFKAPPPSAGEKGLDGIIYFLRPIILVRPRERGPSKFKFNLFPTHFIKVILNPGAGAPVPFSAGGASPGDLIKV